MVEVKIHYRPGQGDYKVTPSQIDVVGSEGEELVFSLSGPPSSPTAFVQFDDGLNVDFEKNHYGELEVPRGDLRSTAMIRQGQNSEGAHYLTVILNEWDYAQADSDPIIIVHPPLN